MLSYFLCSEQVFNLFQEFEYSIGFEGGYKHDEEIYRIGLVNFVKINEFYILNDGDSFTNFWCRECVSGSMDVSKISLSGIKKNGIFLEMENKIGLTTETNRAMAIKNLSEKFGLNPIEFIDKYCRTL